MGFENGRNSNFEGLVTLTLTLDPVIRHTVVHHSSTSTYIPNFIEIEEIFLWTDVRTYGRTFFPPLILLGRLSEVDLIIIITGGWISVFDSARGCTVITGCQFTPQVQGNNGHNAARDIMTLLKMFFFSIRNARISFDFTPFHRPILIGPLQ